MSEYLDRKTVLKILEDHPAGTWRGYNVYSDDVRAIMRDIDEQPAADVAPVRRGEWGCYKPICNGYPCSSCKLTHRNCTTYCPNCGAKMKGVAP